jgi:hypothetical protein
MMGRGCSTVHIDGPARRGLITVISSSWEAAISATEVSLENGLLYRFIRGKPCGHQDLVSPPIWRGVARRLAPTAGQECMGLGFS